MISFNTMAQTLVLRSAAMPDLDAIVELHHRGVEDTPPGAFRRDGDDFFADAITRGLCVVADDGVNIVGYGTLVCPEEGVSSVAAAAGLDPHGVVHVESAVVHRALRGTGLHRQLIRWRVAQARRAGARRILSTVSPDNPASLRNLLVEGFRVRALTQLYGGLRRYVLAQEPGNDRPQADGASASITADAADQERCGALLKEGWVAVAASRQHNHLELVFVR